MQDAHRLEVGLSSNQKGLLLKIKADARKLLGISIQPLVAVLELAPGSFSGYPLLWTGQQVTGPGLHQLMYAFTLRPCWMLTLYRTPAAVAHLHDT